MRTILNMLRTCTAGCGNLLLNIGPHPDGTDAQEAVTRLATLGKWLEHYGEVLYGQVDYTASLTSALGNWTRKGDKHYFWCSRWPGAELAIGALCGKLVNARLFPEGPELPFRQVEDRLVIAGLPEHCPDAIAQTAIIELTFKDGVRQFFNAGPVAPEVCPTDFTGKELSANLTSWKLSALQAKTGSVAEAPAVSLDDALGWQPITSRENDGFVLLHHYLGEGDGIVYLGMTIDVPCDGSWLLHLGHDGGVRVFNDGHPLFSDEKCVNPAIPGRSSIDLSLSAGRHELMIAFDTAAGRGWGIFACFEQPEHCREKGAKPVYPTVVG